MNRARRRWLLRGAALAGAWRQAAAGTAVRTAAASGAATASRSVEAAAPGASGPDRRPVVEPGRPIELPRDMGAHFDYRTEWWYVTGWLDRADGGSSGAVESAGERGEAAYGFQLTFFRTRTDVVAEHPSRFAARQLLSAHAALSDVTGRRLRHDQRIARAGFGIAEASGSDTAVVLRDWRLGRSGPLGQHRYDALIAAPAQGFGFALRFDATQPVLLQGIDGYSRKGPQPSQASYYLSEPQLAASGTLRLDGRAVQVAGRAWLDHEWSEALLHPDAVGWDWIGMNLDDGGALTAFRLRRRDGSALWAGGSFRPKDGAPVAFGPDDVRFTPLRDWTSPATRARYPVQWAISTPAGRFEVRARLDAQELDSRASTGTVYWEGLSDLHAESGERVGRGYLEMTGYAAALRL